MFRLKSFKNECFHVWYCSFWVINSIILVLCTYMFWKWYSVIWVFGTIAANDDLNSTSVLNYESGLYPWLHSLRGSPFFSNESMTLSGTSFFTHSSYSLTGDRFYCKKKLNRFYCKKKLNRFYCKKLSLPLIDSRVKIYGVSILKFGMTPVKYNLIVYFGGFVVCRYLLN